MRSFKLNPSDWAGDHVASGLQPAGLKSPFYWVLEPGAGLILENARCGRTKHIWLSTAADLRIDARRDLDDIKALDVELHALNRQPYCNLNSSEVKCTACIVSWLLVAVNHSTACGVGLAVAHPTLPLQAEVTSFVIW